MWLILGSIAILTAMLHVLWFFKNKETKWLRFISMSFTLLSVCAFYGVAASQVVHEDWSALMDITPTMSKALWVLSFASIGINSVSLWFKKSR